jgi:hypothetical protein
MKSPQVPRLILSLCLVAIEGRLQMIEWVVERLIAIIPTIGEMSREKRELADDAFRSVSEALTETSIYVSRYARTGEREEETQAMLARLWSAAAIPLRHIDQELSDICEYKSEYWVDPESWAPEKTNGIAIDLETVREKYRERLH